MNVLVIGAAGKTGRAVVAQALAAGHEVTAFMHVEQLTSDQHLRQTMTIANS